jgi:plasmid stabilization system protein ParE
MTNKYFNVAWAKNAANDLEAIVSYVSENDLTEAFEIYSEIKNAASELNHFPARGRFVPELGKYGIKIYREIIIKVWRILFRIEKNTVYIITVFDSRRNFEDILLERLLKN